MSSPLSPAGPSTGQSSLLMKIVILFLAVLSIGGFVYFIFLNESIDENQALVVYVAHDRKYSEPVLREFEKETGIKLDIRYDQEKTKSLGLIERIKNERGNPVADVFWNNELFGTIDLQNNGLTLPHQGSGWERIPETYRDADGHWVGFGARMRVVIFHNSVNVNEKPQIVTPRFYVFKADDYHDLSGFAYAKPIYGTTLTHMAVMWYLKGGEEGFKSWYDSLKSRKATMVDGNGPVRDQVAAGAKDFGWTDTDDYFGAEESGKPVFMLPVFVGHTPELFLSMPPADSSESAASGQASVSIPKDHHVIMIPNTATIIKGTNKREDAQKLIDFLASRENEIRLAKSDARQIPLGDYGDAQLPEQVKRIQPYVQYGIPLDQMMKARNEVLDYLKKELEKDSKG